MKYSSFDPGTFTYIHVSFIIIHTLEQRACMERNDFTMTLISFHVRSCIHNTFNRITQSHKNLFISYLQLHNIKPLLSHRICVISSQLIHYLSETLMIRLSVIVTKLILSILFIKRIFFHIIIWKNHRKVLSSRLWGIQAQI